MTTYIVEESYNRLKVTVEDGLNENDSFDGFTMVQRAAKAGAIASALGYIPFVCGMTNKNIFSFRKD